MKEECPHERKGKETGKSHYSDSADLYQDHNDNVPDMCKSSRYVNRSQSRYTDRGRCREQRIDKMNRAGCRVRQHQQSGSDQDHKNETQQEQQWRLDTCLHKRKSLPWQMDHTEQ